MKYRKNILKTKNPFLPGRLSFELAQRVIREESFFESAFQFLQRASMWWRNNLVNLHSYVYTVRVHFIFTAIIWQLHSWSSSRETTGLGLFGWGVLYFMWPSTHLNQILQGPLENKKSQLALPLLEEMKGYIYLEKKNNKAKRDLKGVKNKCQKVKKENITFFQNTLFIYIKQRDRVIRTLNCICT